MKESESTDVESICPIMSYQISKAFVGCQKSRCALWIDYEDGTGICSHRYNALKTGETVDSLDSINKFAKES